MSVDQYAKWKGVDVEKVRIAFENGQLTKSIDGLIDPGGPPIGLTQAEYARHRESAGLRGSTRQMVAKAASAGWLMYHVDGSIDPEGSDHSWSEKATVRIDTEPAHSKPQPPTPKLIPDTPSRSSSVPDIGDSRAEAEYHKARKWKHEADLIEGRVIDKHKAKAAFDEVFRLVQRRIMAIADRVSAPLAGLTDEKKIYKILAEECNQALIDSADGITQRLELDMESADADG